MWKEAVMWPGVSLGGLRKTTKNLSPFSRSSRRVGNTSTPVHEVGIPPTIMRRSVSSYLLTSIFTEFKLWHSFCFLHYYVAFNITLFFNTLLVYFLLPVLCLLHFPSVFVFSSTPSFLWTCHHIWKNLRARSFRAAPCAEPKRVFVVLAAIQSCKVRLGNIVLGNVWFIKFWCRYFGL